MSNNKTIELPVLSWALLRNMLSQPGWAKTPKDLYIAGKLDASDKLNPEGGPGPGAKPEENRAWNSSLVKHEYLGKEVDCVARCINTLTSEGKLGADRYVLKLIEAFVDLE